MREEIKEEENRKKLFESVITEKFLNLMKPVHSQIQAAYGTLSTRNMKKLYQGTSSSNCLKSVVKRKS